MDCNAAPLSMDHVHVNRTGPSRKLASDTSNVDRLMQRTSSIVLFNYRNKFSNSSVIVLGEISF
jgi:hypothetical protein